MPSRYSKYRWLKWLLILAIIDICAYLWWAGNKKERQYDKIIQNAAMEFKVEFALIKAVIWQESRFNEKAVGKAGEIGLMQLMELAAFEWADKKAIEDFEHSHVFDPNTNILAGTYYLKTRIARYKHTDNPLPFALADYNAGRANVLRWATGSARTNSVNFIKKIDFPSTRKYINQVSKRRKQYR
ncbi:MAG: lytic transglycosylase domain-containing protein [Verrucomicrobiota bacterium]|nr:lytic transglycosylase domain-containing protein [Verrucomicrobiota bacterium]